MKQNSLRLFAIAAFLFSQSSVFAQEKQFIKPYQNHSIVHKSYANEQGVIRCHTMEMDSVRRANDPSLPSLWEDELWLQEKIQEFEAQQASGAMAKKVVVTIPIIFHIFTDLAGAENVSAAVVQAQLDQLNLDYRDLAGSTYPQAADVEINFCLAVVDPNGTPLVEAGINRVTTYGDGPFSSTQFDNTLKAATQWDPNNYFNVWVADLSGGLLGYAQFPSSSGLSGMPGSGGAASTDGCVILYSSLGSVADPQGSVGAPYNKGRTLTHEAGHWLGLRHIWGDATCGNDFCADTPQSSTSNFGCPNPTTCDGINDMVENYMDYTDDACMNTFTANQKTRILTVLANSPRRGSLTTSTVCAAPNPDDAGISGITTPSGTICGSTTDPVVTLTNYGNNSLTSVDILYNLDGGANQTFNWTGTLAPGASVNVTLPTLSPSSGPHVFNASTSNPNGTTDSNSSNDANSGSFTIVLGGELATLTINTDCWGEEIYWELLDAGLNVVYSGGNTTGIPPGGQQTGTSQSDPGAYASEATITETWCLAVGCYDFIIYDDYGDGLDGTASGCAIDGDWQITDGAAQVLAQMSTPDYGDSETANFCIQAPCASTFTSVVNEEDCFGDNDATATVSFTSGNASGATYDIGSGAQGTGAFTGLSQGSYTVTVVDGDLCTSYISITVSGPSQLNPTIMVNNISCNGQTDGQIVVSGNNTGTPTYTYDIGSGPVSSGTFSGLSAGPYSILVTDANGCTATENGTVIEPAVLAASAGTITPEFFGNDGSVNLSVSGGTAGYTYAWTGPGGYTSSAQDPNNMAGGTYSVTITDSEGCTTTVSNIVVPSELGIDENGNVQFVIYPNPSNGQFHVQLMNGESMTNVNVTDVAGRIVYEMSDLSNNTFVVDLTDASNGTYMLNISTASRTYVKRLVLKK